MVTSGLYVLLVCGGREYEDRRRVFKLLDRYLDKYTDDLVILHGHCPTGADKFANDWAEARSVACIRVPAKWTKYKKSAGFIRNDFMAKRFIPSKAIAFPGGPGTKMMVDLCHKQNILCKVIKG